ncbi:hypothetical protein [Rhizobium halophytocola]|uniref:CHASE3 domain sensor protein n=1 Tax=Rhizobium halophytocola TaxID=735519 RepID=A0ABS4DW04_9HYPH|nr:hypothetical protein [Rhizobium halophytocola]MBP1849878.1 CHASE3 domain sensor protein [Rhizobium halophytocola]
MTDIRTNGFDSDAQRREYINEAQDYVDDMRDQTQARAIRAEIARLSDEVETLRQRLGQSRDASQRASRHPWIRAGVTLATSLLLSRLSSALHLGVIGKLAAPIIGVRISRLV